MIAFAAGFLIGGILSAILAEWEMRRLRNSLTAIFAAMEQREDVAILGPDQMKE